MHALYGSPPQAFRATSTLLSVLVSPTCNLITSTPVTWDRFHTSLLFLPFLLGLWNKCRHPPILTQRIYCIFLSSPSHLQRSQTEAEPSSTSISADNIKLIASFLSLFFCFSFKLNPTILTPPAQTWTTPIYSADETRCQYLFLSVNRAETLTQAVVRRADSQPGNRLKQLEMCVEA